MSKTSNALSTSEQWPANAIPKRWIESLFDKMLFEYGKKFTDQWGGSDPEALKAHWAARLSDLTGDELKRGVMSMSGREFPPTLPEFRKLCRPSCDVTAAYYHAVNGVQARERGEMGEWPHPAIYWASVKVGPYDLKSQSYSQIKGRWEHAFRAEMERGAWNPVPDPMAALPAPGKSAPSRENATRMVQELRAESITKKSSSPVDHRAWAKRILEREKRGDRTLTAVQVRFAREAIGAPESEAAW